jgi:prefoldin subunit 5
MTEQQEHLASLLQQRQTLSEEIKKFDGEIGSRKELILKVQGAIEYLAQIGVTLPEPESEPEPEEETDVE